MTDQKKDIFELLAEQNQDIGEMLENIISHFRMNQQPMELFEALKMRTRVQLELPLIGQENEVRRAEDVERQLEKGLLDACRETGSMLIQLGKIGEGWMYLRPTGDIQNAKELLATVEINDDNYDDMIQVLLQ